MTAASIPTSETAGIGSGTSRSYISRAVLKMNHARQLFETLERSLAEWNAQHPLMAPARSPYEGEPRVELFRPEVLDRIPSEAWEFQFHDAVHNLRAALDSLCFEMCHFERPPSNPRKVHFPITAKLREWDDQARHLNSMPKPLLERVRECQPWARTDPQTPDPLQLIARIDNVDKHQAAGVTFELMPMLDHSRPDAHLPPELASSLEWPLAPWTVLSISPPLPRGEAALLPVTVVPIVLFEGLLASVPDAQRWLDLETQRVVSFIASGTWPDAEFERLFPGPTWQPVGDSQPRG